MCAGFAAHGRRPASEDRERSICEKSSICRPAPTTNKNVPLSSKKDGGDAGRDGLFFRLTPLAFARSFNTSMHRNGKLSN